MLIQRLQGKAVDSPPPLKTTLIVRASTSSPAGSKEVVGDTE